MDDPTPQHSRDTDPGAVSALGEAHSIVDDTAATGPRRRTAMRLVDIVGLVLVAVVVRLPAYVAARHLSFDDGTFASSALAMRDGALPFRDVFSSQGPLFLPLVWLGDLIGFRTLNSPRTIAVISGVVCVVATYWIASRISDRVGALMAGALVATSGSLMWVTVSLAADGPALAFAALAFGLCLVVRDRPSWTNAALLGLAVGACLSTKAMEAPILAPVALVLLAPVLHGLRSGDRRLAIDGAARAALAGATAAALFVVVSVPFGFADVWDQSFSYRTEASTGLDIGGNAAKIISTLWDRDLVLLLFCVVTVVAAVLARRRAGGAATSTAEGPTRNADGADVERRIHSTKPVPSDALLAWMWLTVTVAWMVVVVTPLWRPHVSAMVLPVVVVLALHRPAVKTLAVCGVVAVVLLPAQLDGLWFVTGYRGDDAAIVEQLEALPSDAWVLSGEPGLVWRAGLRTNDDLVDPSMLRVQQGRYTEDSLAADAGDRRVCAVVIVSDQRFGAFDGLPDRLSSAGFEQTLDLGDGHGVFTRPDCRPTG